MGRTAFRKLYESRIARTVLLLALLAAFLLPATQRQLMDNSLFQKGDVAATEHTNASLKRAVISYGLARATNAIISVFQESEISVQPAGIGATVAIFQALDPLNDLIERFSSVMLWVIVSLGIQRFLIELAPWLSSKLIILGLVACIIGLWTSRSLPVNAASVGKKIIIFAVAVRFIMPLVTLANESVYHFALESRYEEAITGAKKDNVALFGEMGDVDRQKVLEKKKQELNTKELNLMGLRSQRSTMQNLFGDSDEINRLEDEITALKSEIEAKDEDAGFTTKKLKEMNPLSTAIKEKVDSYVDKFINLLTIFCVNTIVFPLLFLWGGLKGITVLLRGTLERAHAVRAGQDSP